jgi:hypothetical protein
MKSERIEGELKENEKRKIMATQRQIFFIQLADSNLAQSDQLRTSTHSGKAEAASIFSSYLAF